MFSFKTALRFITYSKFQSFLIVLGIAVGVGVQIFVGILIDSLQSSLVDQTIGTAPHINITSDTGRITDWKTIENQANQLTDIKTAQVLVDNNALITKDSKSYPVLVRGMELDQSGIYKIKDHLQSGRLPANNNEYLMGVDLAETTGYSLNDEVPVIQADGKKQSIKIVGTFDQKVAAVNKTWLVTTVANAQSLFNLGDDASSVEIQIEDPFKADTQASNLQSQIGSSYTVDNWKAQNAQLLSALQGQSTSSYMIQVFVLLSVVIAIASVLAITVMQKSRQIGILKAMGTTDKRTSAVFVYLGSMLGFIGVALGMAFGLLLFYSFVTFAKNADGTSIVTPYYRWLFIGATGIIAFLAATVAGLIPAIKSRRLNPIDIIRNN